jgi:oligopeptide/dipeptide ABC transporter ATP-binding protein
MSAAGPIVRLTDLSVAFPMADGRLLHAVDRVSISVSEGELVGIVGESGSGKSVTAQAMLGLTAFNGGQTVAGHIAVSGSDMAEADQGAWRAIRGRTIGMVFQEPLSALNPLLSIGTQMKEAIDRAPARADQPWQSIAVELLSEVQISEPATRLGQFPHELSGGMRQRVTIAMALAQHPRLLIADEATTALDVTVQREIVELLLRLNRDRGLAVVFISHDLALVGEFCRRIVVMYGGRIVEEGAASDVLSAPKHPYTELLLRARPSATGAARERRLVEIEGTIEPAFEPARLCRFLARCPAAIAPCEGEDPPWRASGGRHTRCWRES